MIKKALGFLNLLDHDGNLSISNIAVIVGIVKMAMSSHLTGVDSVALIGTLLNYAHKRLVNDGADK